MATRNTKAVQVEETISEPEKANDAAIVPETAPEVSAVPEVSAAPAATTEKLTNARIDSEAKGMKAVLDARPKRQIKIKGEKGAPPVAVGINGYVYRVPVNKWVEVPDVVADLLEKGDYI